MKTRHTAVIAAIAAMCLGSVGSAGAQSPTSDATEGDLADISRSIRQLVELLDDHLAQRERDFELRRVEVAIAALDLRSRAMLQMQDRLQRIQDERDTAEGRRSLLEQQVAEFEERVRTTDQTTDGQTHLNLSRAIERLTAESELIENTIWELERQALDLQNQIARERDSLRHLEEIVDEALDSL